MGAAYSISHEENISSNDSVFQQVLSQSYFSDGDNNYNNQRPISHSFLSDEDDEKSAYTSEFDNSHVGGRSANGGGDDGSDNTYGRKRKQQQRRSAGAANGRNGRGGNKSKKLQPTNDRSNLRSSFLELESKDRWVSCTKAAVLIVLVVAASLVGVTTHKYTLREQQDDFHAKVRCK